MSGSPVYVVQQHNAPSTKAHLDPPKVNVEFLGIYSGSTGNAQLGQLSLGRFAYAGAIDGLVNANFEEGSNPYPPTHLS